MNNSDRYLADDVLMEVVDSALIAFQHSIIDRSGHISSYEHLNLARVLAQVPCRVTFLDPPDVTMLPTWELHAQPRQSQGWYLLELGANQNRSLKKKKCCLSPKAARSASLFCRYCWQKGKKHDASSAPVDTNRAWRRHLDHTPPQNPSMLGGMKNSLDPRRVLELDKAQQLCLIWYADARENGY